MKFKMYDEIVHPKYGRGVIKKIERQKTGLVILTVIFEKEGLKKLFDAEWVKENCDCSACPDSREYVEKYVPYPLPEFPEWRVEINSNEIITDSMISNLKYLLTHAIPGIGFMIIGECSAVGYLPKEDKGYKAIETFARKQMRSVFQDHPDFDVFSYDDNGWMLTMNGCLFHYIKPSSDSDQPSTADYLTAREDLMEQCDSGHFFAIVKGY